MCGHPQSLRQTPSHSTQDRPPPVSRLQTAAARKRSAQYQISSQSPRSLERTQPPDHHKTLNLRLNMKDLVTTSFCLRRKFLKPAVHPPAQSQAQATVQTLQTPPMPATATIINDVRQPLSRSKNHLPLSARALPEPCTPTPLTSILCSSLCCPRANGQTAKGLATVAIDR